MDASELNKYKFYHIEKIFNGTVEHGCCLCQARVKERKLKVLARSADRNKQFFFCVKCFDVGMQSFSQE